MVFETLIEAKKRQAEQSKCEQNTILRHISLILPKIGTKLIRKASQLLTLKAELKAPVNIKKIVPGPRIVPIISMI